MATIAIADDPFVAGLLMRMLRKVGHEAISVSSSLELLRLYQHRSVDVIMYDWWFDAGKAAKEMASRTTENAASRPRVIVLTSVTHGGDIVAGDAILEKPFSMKEMASIVQSVLAIS